MTGAPARLSRSIFGRLFGGTALQWILTLSLVMSVVVMLSRGGDYLRLVAVDAVVVVLWVFGLTAWAEADREGVRWRGFVRRQFSWAEIERVAVVRPRLGGVNSGGNLVVRVRERNRVIGPASMVGSNLVDFARGLAVLAAERGIPADVP